MTSVTRQAPRIHVPDLGPRGEGWVVLQAILFVAVIATGFAGPAWAGRTSALGALAGLALIAGGVALIAGGILGLRRQLTAFPRPVDDGQLIGTAPSASCAIPCTAAASSSRSAGEC